MFLDSPPICSLHQPLKISFLGNPSSTARRSSSQDGWDVKQGPDCFNAFEEWSFSTSSSKPGSMCHCLIDLIHRLDPSIELGIVWIHQILKRGRSVQSSRQILDAPEIRSNLFHLECVGSYPRSPPSSPRALPPLDAFECERERNSMPRFRRALFLAVPLESMCLEETKQSRWILLDQVRQPGGHEGGSRASNHHPFLIPRVHLTSLLEIKNTRSLRFQRPSNPLSSANRGRRRYEQPPLESTTVGMSSDLLGIFRLLPFFALLYSDPSILNEENRRIWTMDPSSIP